VALMIFQIKIHSPFGEDYAVRGGYSDHGFDPQQSGCPALSDLKNQLMRKA